MAISLAFSLSWVANNDFTQIHNRQKYYLIKNLNSNTNSVPSLFSTIKETNNNNDIKIDKGNGELFGIECV